MRKGYFHFPLLRSERNVLFSALNDKVQATDMMSVIWGWGGVMKQDWLTVSEYMGEKNFKPYWVFWETILDHPMSSI